MIIDTEHNNRDKWINEIKKYTDETDTWNVIQFALSYTLQACRNGDIDQYKWGDKKCF